MTKPIVTALPESTARVLPDEEEGADIVIDTADSLVPVTEVAPAEKEAAPSDDDVPEPLRGKSVKELAAMYTEAQRVIGRQSQEVGEVRRLADSLIKAQLAEKHRREAAAALNTNPEKKESDDDTEFFSKPRDAVAKAVAAHPEIQQLKAATAAALARERMTMARAAEEQFGREFPDAGETLQDAGFREWVGASKVRQALLLRAHKAYDLDAAREVFGTWKAIKDARASASAAPAAQKVRAAVQKKAVSAATVPAGNAGASAGASSDRIYRRADILRLMENDPERYEAMADEIKLAYEQGRVR